MADVDRRVASLASEIEKLRNQLTSEMAAEGERIKRETESMLTRIQQQAEQEIAFLTKSARNELRAHSANLAIDLAQQRIAQRMNPQTQRALVDRFVSSLPTVPDEVAQ